MLLRLKSYRQSRYAGWQTLSNWSTSLESIQLARQAFKESIQTKIDSADALPEAVADAADLITHCLVSGHRILTCGEGICAALAQLFTTQLLHQLERERPGLPVVSLSDSVPVYSAISQTTGRDEVFARQVRALGLSGDVLVSFSVSSDAPACAQAIRTALAKDMLIVAICGDDDGDIWGLTSADDAEIRIPSTRIQRVTEIQLMVTNAMVTLIETNLFGNEKL